MLVVNEFLPNPAGSDAAGEWVELWNGGEAPIDLRGWRLENGNGKVYALRGTIEGNGYAVLRRSSTKLTLRNNDEHLRLYDGDGSLRDELFFRGSAPEGKSVSRLFDETRRYAWSNPTPGAPNEIVLGASMARNNHPSNVPLNRQFSATDFIALTLAGAVLIAGFMVYAVRKHAGLLQLFFKRDEGIR